MAEITNSLIQIDLEGTIETREMCGSEMSVYNYCLRHGSKNNTGIFIESRYDIAQKLKIDHDIVYKFFEKFPKTIYFCPDTHLIWVKPFFARVDLGLRSDIWKVEGDEETGSTKKIKQFHVLVTKNRFVEKINKSFKEPLMAADGRMFFLKNHPVAKEWIEHNRLFLEMVNEDVKSVKGNNYNLDYIFSLAKEEGEKVINNSIHR